MGASKKVGTLYLILQPLKLPNSNLVHNLQRLGPKLAGVLAREHSKKNCDPLLISATVESNDFKFGTQLGLEE